MSASSVEESPYTTGAHKLVSAVSLDLLLLETVPLAQTVVKTLIGSVPDDDVYFRIEGYGYQLGQGLAQIFTRERPWFTERLEVMKFVCKELWVILYKKPIDNLKTNHRGTYVLIDNNFKYCQRMSTSQGAQETLKRATPYLWFPAGVIRGTLAALGIESTVTFDANELPGVTFNIHTEGA